MTIDKIRFSPCYISYKTLENFISRLEQHLPDRIDRSYWGKFYSGSAGMQIMSALRFLNLMDGYAKPMPRLKLLVSGIAGKKRTVLLRQITNEAYAFVFKGVLAIQNASYADLEYVFQNTYYMPNDICRKYVNFFIDFSKDAGIPVNPQITKKRKSQNNIPGNLN